VRNWLILAFRVKNHLSGLVFAVLSKYISARDRTQAVPARHMRFNSGVFGTGNLLPEPEPRRGTSRVAANACQAILMLQVGCG
jgi:hypothetical protein